MAKVSERAPWGSNPPYLTLAKLITLAGQVYEQGGGRVSKDLLSRLTGNSTSSSSFTKKLAALKDFGLLNAISRDEYELSEQGIAIAAPTDPMATSQAKKDSFLRNEVFKRLYERHRGKLLPADEFLKNAVEQECEIPRHLSAAWVAAFKDDLRTAGLAHDRGDGKVQILESPITRFWRSSASEATPPTSATSEAGHPTFIEDHVAPVAVPAGGHTTRIEFSNGRVFSCSIPDALSPKEAHRIKGALSGLGAIIDSMISDAEET